MISNHVAYRAEGGSFKATRPLRVALAGCGHVASALLDLFAEHTVADQRVGVSHILVRDGSRERPSFTRAIEHGLASKAATTIDRSRLLDGDGDVPVELIGGTTTAHTLVENALGRGIRVVSANKALLATSGPALTALAASRNTTLEYEGAVAAAVLLCNTFDPAPLVLASIALPAF